MTTPTLLPGAPAVGKDRKKAEDKQIAFRLSGELYGRLQAAADGLELDVSSLLRTMIREHLPAYEDRAEAIRQKEQRERG